MVAVAVAACGSKTETSPASPNPDRAPAVDASQRFPSPPEPSTLRALAGDYVQVNNLPSVELPGLQELIPDIFSRTHRFAADGSTTVLIDKTGEVHARGNWQLIDRSLELTEGSEIVLRGHYYGEEIRVTPGSLDNPEAALIILRRK